MVGAATARTVAPAAARDARAALPAGGPGQTRVTPTPRARAAIRAPTISGSVSSSVSIASDDDAASIRSVKTARLLSGDVTNRPLAPAGAAVASAANTASAAATSAASPSSAAYSRLPASPASVRFSVSTASRAWSTINAFAWVYANREDDQRTSAPAAASAANAGWLASSFRYGAGSRMTRTSQPTRARSASAATARASVSKYISVQMLVRAPAIRSTIASGPASGSMTSATGACARVDPSGGASPQAGSQSARANVSPMIGRGQSMTGTPRLSGGPVLWLRD